MSGKNSGMTVNERLYNSGRMEEFELASESKNERVMKDILKELEVDEIAIDKILKQQKLIR